MWEKRLFWKLTAQQVWFGQLVDLRRNTTNAANFSKGLGIGECIHIKLKIVSGILIHSNCWLNCLKLVILGWSAKSVVWTGKSAEKRRFKKCDFWKFPILTPQSLCSLNLIGNVNGIYPFWWKVKKTFAEFTWYRQTFTTTNVSQHTTKLRHLPGGVGSSFDHEVQVCWWINLGRCTGKGCR